MYRRLEYHRKGWSFYRGIKELLQPVCLHPERQWDSIPLGLPTALDLELQHWSSWISAIAFWTQQQQPPLTQCVCVRACVCSCIRMCKCKQRSQINLRLSPLFRDSFVLCFCILQAGPWAFPTSLLFLLPVPSRGTLGLQMCELLHLAFIWALEVWTQAIRTCTAITLPSKPLSQPELVLFNESMYASAFGAMSMENSDYYRDCGKAGWT